MLAMFSPNLDLGSGSSAGAEATSASASGVPTSDSPSAKASVLALGDSLQDQLGELHREVASVQAQHEYLMRSLQTSPSTFIGPLSIAGDPSRSLHGADVLGCSRSRSSSPKTRTDGPGLPIRPATHPYGRGKRRSSSWAWDPQVQHDLEQSFQVNWILPVRRLAPLPCFVRCAWGSDISVCPARMIHLAFRRR